MAVVAILGAFLTLVCLAFLGLAGYLVAWLARRPGERSREEGDPRADPLLFAVDWLVAATGVAVAIGLVLGIAGLLKIEVALAVLALLVLGLQRRARRGADGGELGAPARAVAAAAWRQARRFPVLALLALHAGGSEALRGLLRPPLSWDSVMYHLFLTGTWLQQGSFELVAARQPTAFYQFMPGNGSIWVWWWMAPSHSELFANLAYLPHWLLLGLAAGAFARRLGARESWPIAAFLTLMAPTVVRFVATQYVDVSVGALVAAGALYLARWIERPRAADAVAAGAALGLAAGTKVLGLLYGPALAGVAVLLVLLARERGRWRRRVGQLAAAAAVAALLGGFFYARNLALGGGPFGYLCAERTVERQASPLDKFPLRGSLLEQLGPAVAEGRLTGAFLGSTRPTSLELGLGPQALVLLAVGLLLPWIVPREGRRDGWLAWSQIVVQLVIWVIIPYAVGAHIYANVRYLIGAAALAFAGAAAAGERLLPPGWLRLLAVAAAAQDLLMQRAELPHQVRVLYAWLLAGAVALGVSPALRRAVVRFRLPLAGAALVALLAAAAPLAELRVADRSRSFAQDLTAHLSGTRFFASGWGWLDQHAADGTVAVAFEPKNFFVYPAMGPFLERRAIYVNVNAADHANPLAYPGCQPRVDFSADAWLANLRRHEVRWLHVARYPQVDYPPEARWAAARPDLFRLRFEDRTNRIYEVLGGPAAAGAR